MTQFFWNSYKRLEKELLSLAEVIHISDDQLGVYSSKIGDLLVRTAIECEALSKELYHANGGTKPNGEASNLFLGGLRISQNLCVVKSKISSNGSKQ